MLVTFIVSKWVTGREGVNGHQESETWLAKFWPATYTDYQNLCYRLHVGALVEILGEFRTGSYQDPKTKVWHNNPYIHPLNFSVLSKAPWRLAEEAKAEAEFSRQHEEQSFPNANTADQGPNVAERAKAGSATRRKATPVAPHNGDLPQPTTGQYTNDLDDDLPF